MDREIEGVVRILLELIVCSIVIGVIAVAGSLGIKMYNTREEKVDSKEVLQESTELFRYNNSIITGSDVMELILTYTDTYTYHIVTTAKKDIYITNKDISGNEYTLPSYIKSNSSNSKAFMDYWTEARLTKLFRQTISNFNTSNIKSTVVYNIDGSISSGVKEVLLEMQ
jgi:hypothetical protein